MTEFSFVVLNLAELIGLRDDAPAAGFVITFTYGVAYLFHNRSNDSLYSRCIRLLWMNATFSQCNANAYRK